MNAYGKLGLALTNVLLLVIAAAVVSGVVATVGFAYFFMRVVSQVFLGGPW